MTQVTASIRKAPKRHEVLHQHWNTGRAYSMGGQEIEAVLYSDAQIRFHDRTRMIKGWIELPSRESISDITPAELEALTMKAYDLGDYIPA